MTVEILSFSEVIEDLTRFATKIPKSAYASDGKYPIIDQSQNSIAGYTDDENFLYREKVPVIVFGDHTRKFKYIDSQFTIGADGTKILSVKGYNEPRFIYHYLKNQHLPDAGYSRHYKYLKEITFTLPSLEEQQRIVDILDRAENIIRLRQLAIETTQQITSALFYEMFGNPANNEKGWNTTTIAQITSNIQKSHPKEVFNNTFPYIDISSIDNTVGKINKVKNVAVDDAPSRARQIVATNDVLVSTVRPNLRAFALVNNSNSGAICSTGFSVLRCDGTVHPIYLFTYVRLNAFVDAMMAKARGASYPAIGDADVRNHTLILPPIERQLEFAGRVEILYRVDRRQSQSAIKIEQLSSALRTQLFAT